MRASRSLMPTWRGQGWKDGAQDVRLFRAAVLEGQRCGSRLPRYPTRAQSEARTVADAAGNEKLAKDSVKGGDASAGETTWRRLSSWRLQRGSGGKSAATATAKAPLPRGGCMSWRRLRLNKRRWDAVRRRVLERDGWRCTKCGRPGRLEVHHLTPLHRGGDPWAMSNLETLCRGCHIEAGRRKPTPAEEAWQRMVQGVL